MKAPRVYRVTAHAATQFPVDMLRYDSCWPSDPEAVCAIEASVGRTHKRGFQVIALVSAKPPTVDRWKSFGWAVLEYKREAIAR